ncbi:putative HVA22-like protein g [Andrographis paniculata]|uniref:putative HVA22-like protein g n=1 Tax=Andrographis paniculata TaxID=175694 RepID=UPI0021E6EB05|nr:putative HVA22-like protein g [Andrographis paniculata]
MIGSLLNRVLVLIFGYAYPAYECYKSVEMNKPNIEQLRFWCQYWILVALLTVGEKIGDFIVGWLPMYGEFKLAFFMYLWFPKTKGTTYIYNSFFRPYIAKHETEIDRQLLELRTRAGDMVFMYWQKSAGYLQTRVLEILQYIVSQSPLKQPVKPQHEAAAATSIPEYTTPSKPTSPQKQIQDKPISPASSTDNNRQRDTNKDEAAARPSGDSSSSANSTNKHKETSTQSLSETSKEQESQADSAQSADQSSNPTTLRNMLMEETGGPFTRARLRKVTAAAAAAAP